MHVGWLRANLIFFWHMLFRLQNQHVFSFRYILVLPEWECPYIMWSEFPGFLYLPLPVPLTQNSQDSLQNNGFCKNYYRSPHGERYVIYGCSLVFVDLSSLIDICYKENDKRNNGYLSTLVGAVEEAVTIKLIWKI